MRTFHRIAFVLLAVMVANASVFDVCHAGKPSSGGGNTDPPATPPVTLDVTWLGSTTYLNSRANDVNNQGVVVGDVWDTNAAFPCFVWDPLNDMHELNDLADTPGFSLEYGVVINDNNVILGWARDLNTAGWEIFRCHYDPLALTASVEILEGSKGSGQIALSESGDAAFVGAGIDEVLIYYADGSVSSMTIPGVESVAGINSSGQLLVRAVGGGYRYTPGESPLLLSGYTPYDMNIWGSVCATTNFPGTRKAVRYRDIDGELILSTSESRATGINNFDDVCGVFSKGKKGSIIKLPFLMLEGLSGVNDINTLLLNGGDATWKSATEHTPESVSDQLEVCGTAVLANTFKQAFLLSPLPLSNE